MATPLINMTVTPTIAQVKAQYDAVYKELSNYDTPNQRIRVMLDSWVQRNFRSSGGKVGGWKPLAAGGRWKTAAQGGRVFDPSAKPLQDTGRLRLSFLTFARKVSGRNQVGIGSAVPYSKQHEDGEGKMPQRRMLPKSSEVAADVGKIFLQWTGKAIKRRKLG